MSTSNSPTSSLTKLRQKKYHRRSPRACDECRLRKCKCDGLSPCGPCRLTDHDCTYDPKTVPVQKPTLRVRELEARLRSIRSLTQELRSRAISNGITGSSAELAALEEAFGLSSPVHSSPLAQGLTPHSEENDSNLLTSMMGTTNRRAIDAFGCGTSYGPNSVFSFVCRILELFEPTAIFEAERSSPDHIVHSLFNAAMPARATVGYQLGAFGRLPDQDDFMNVLDAAFTHCQPLGRLFHVSELHEVVEQFYQHQPSQYTTPPTWIHPLLHAVLSLGYLFDVEQHRRCGCEHESRVAMYHFYSAADRIDDIQDPSIQGVQTLLCLVIFLLNSSRIGKAHKYLGMACSVALRLGLFPSRGFQTSEFRQAIEIRVFSLLLEFDTYISMLLDLPQYFHVHDLLLPTPTSFSVGRNVDMAFESTAGPSSDDEAEMELSKMHMDLMTNASKALQNAFHVTGKVLTSEPYRTRTATVDESVFKEADAAFRAWMRSLSPLFARTGSTPNFQRFRLRLETTFYLSQLALYFPFLHYLIPSNASKSIYSNQSQIGLSCIKIASNTILRFSKLQETGELLSACWTMVHAIFVSVLCLIFLIAAHEGTSRPGEAWRRAELGIRLLASMRCVDRGALACLDIIKMLIARLKHTVDFDMKEIEATTKRICQAATVTTGSEFSTRHPPHSIPRPIQQNHPPFSIQDLLIQDSTDNRITQLPQPLPPNAGPEGRSQSSLPNILHPTPFQPMYSSSTTSTTFPSGHQLKHSFSPHTQSRTLLSKGNQPTHSIEVSNTGGYNTSHSGETTSLSTDADGILAQAQQSIRTIDFDTILGI